MNNLNNVEKATAIVKNCLECTVGKHYTPGAEILSMISDSPDGMLALKDIIEANADSMVDVWVNHRVDILGSLCDLLYAMVNKFYVDHIDSNDITTEVNLVSDLGALVAVTIMNKVMIGEIEVIQPDSFSLDLWMNLSWGHRSAVQCKFINEKFGKLVTQVNDMCKYAIMPSYEQAEAEADL